MSEFFYALKGKKKCLKFREKKSEHIVFFLSFFFPLNVCNSKNKIDSTFIFHFTRKTREKISNKKFYTEGDVIKCVIGVNFFT